MRAVRFLVIRSLASLSVGFRGKYSNVKNVSVDAPLSQDLFASFFPVNYCGEDSFKDMVSVGQLESVFGKDWHIYNFTNSSTRKRVLGCVLLHYRRKCFKVIMPCSGHRYCIVFIVIVALKNQDLCNAQLRMNCSLFFKKCLSY